MRDVIDVICVLVIIFLTINGLLLHTENNELQQRISEHKCIYTDTIYNYRWITLDSIDHDCYGINPNYHKGKK